MTQGESPPLRIPRPRVFVKMHNLSQDNVRFIERPCRDSFIDICTTFRCGVGGSSGDNLGFSQDSGERQLENGLNGFHVRSRFPKARYTPHGARALSNRLRPTTIHL